MLDAEFDQFAQEYRDTHAASIRFSGESPDFFARYKIDEIARVLRGAGAQPQRILDFGAGIGNSIEPMRAAFPSSEIVALDPSASSLEIAGKRFPGQALLRQFDGETIPYPDRHFDLVLAACVFHHIPESLHLRLLGEIRRVLAVGGSFFVFEHNPLNPLTRHAVRNCSFDENAVLIAGAEMRRRLEDAGFAAPRLAYRIFFPRVLARLRPLERHLGRLPIGGQYLVHSVKRAA